MPLSRDHMNIFESDESNDLIIRIFFSVIEISCKKYKNKKQSHIKTKEISFLFCFKNNYIILFNNSASKTLTHFLATL